MLTASSQSSDRIVPGDLARPRGNVLAERLITNEIEWLRGRDRCLIVAILPWASVGYDCRNHDGDLAAVVLRLGHFSPLGLWLVPEEDLRRLT